jgi:hypothetical protein
MASKSDASRTEGGIRTRTGGPTATTYQHGRVPTLIDVMSRRLARRIMPAPEPLPIAVDR